MRKRLRPAWGPEQLAEIYAEPHKHDWWPDHRLRVQETIRLARELGVPPSGVIADLSCGDAAIAKALVSGTESVLVLGDFAPGYEITGPIEQTIDQVGHADMFICSETIEHLDDPDAVLAKIRGKAGSLVLSTPLAEFHDGNPQHYWGWDTDGVGEMLTAAGWTPVLQRDVHFRPGLGEGFWAAASYQLWGCRLAVSGDMSTALVTGAAGFVGRHFTRRLREQGWKVNAIDIREGPHTAIQDAREFFWYENGMTIYDLVIHAAAVVGGRQVIDNDPMAQAVNFELDAALFRWALRTRPGRVVYFSSSAAYPVALQKAGMNHMLAEDEISHVEPCGPADQLYGTSKRAGEYLAMRAREYGLAVSVVRPFSGYGEDQDDCYPFPAFVDRALRREDPFLVWGSGDQVRDWIHIDDIVTAVMAMYAREISGPVNLCSGQPVAMRVLARRVCAAAGYEPVIEPVPSAPSGVAYRVGSPGRLTKFFYPKVTLEQGIRRALEYRRGLLAGKEYQVHGI